MNSENILERLLVIREEASRLIKQWGVHKLSKPFPYGLCHTKELSPRFYQALFAGTPSGALNLPRKPISKEKPLVSVMTVCLNSERFIGRAIESVLNQTYDNYEYIIQDGGSTDNTHAIIKEYQKKADIKLVVEKDRATLDGMMKALKSCQGDYVAVCWGDDELIPRALDWAVKRFSQTDVDIIYGDQILANDITHKKYVTRGAPWDIKRFFMNEFYPPFSSAYFKKPILDKLEKILTEFEHDEYEFWCLLNALGTIRYMPGMTSVFHVHEHTSWMHGNAIKHINRVHAGKTKAVGRMEALGMLPYDTEQAKKDFAVSVDLWAALHLIYNTNEYEAICDYAEKALANFNGDYRFSYLVDCISKMALEAYDKGLVSMDF